MRCLCDYHWPGNVRELRNEIQRMLVMSDTPVLDAALLAPRVLRAAPPAEEAATDLLAGLDGTLKKRVEALEARVLRETLIRHRWNKSRAAEELGLSRVGLRNKLDRYGLDQRGEPGRGWWRAGEPELLLREMPGANPGAIGHRAATRDRPGRALSAGGRQRRFIARTAQRFAAARSS